MWGGRLPLLYVCVCVCVWGGGAGSRCCVLCVGGGGTDSSLCALPMQALCRDKHREDAQRGRTHTHTHTAPPPHPCPCRRTSFSKASCWCRPVILAARPWTPPGCRLPGCLMRCATMQDRWATCRTGGDRARATAVPGRPLLCGHLQLARCGRLHPTPPHPTPPHPTVNTCRAPLLIDLPVVHP